MTASRSKAVRERVAQAEPLQLPLFKPRGGKRRGAGRKPNGRKAGESHAKRPVLHPRYPVHVTMRVVAEVGNLRRRFAYRAIRQATLVTARREDFRIVHVSIQRTHLHLIVEAASKAALSAGMQGFLISAARHLNAAIGARSFHGGGNGSGNTNGGNRNRNGARSRRHRRLLFSGQVSGRRRGRVFPDRYHAEIITSPRQARHTLSYLLCNWRKHREDRAEPMSRWTIDWFSTAAMFPGWAEYGGEPFLWRGPEGYDPLIVYFPKTWLLREGWKLHGPISYHHVPSAKR